MTTLHELIDTYHYELYSYQFHNTNILHH